MSLAADGKQPLSGGGDVGCDDGTGGGGGSGGGAGVAHGQQWELP